MKRVALELEGQPYEAALLKLGKKTARVGWVEAEVPPALSGRVKGTARAGWLSMIVPTVGENAVTLRDLPRARRPGRAGRRAMGVQTADLARHLASFVASQGWTDRLEVICSHRGVYQDEREDELAGAGVLIRQIGFFIGDDHTNETKAGVSDVAVVTRDQPRRAILLIEIEESNSGTKPKAVIGDALLPVLADRVDVLQEGGSPFRISLDRVAVWVGYHPRPGYDVSRTERLQAKLNALALRGWEGNGAPAAIRLFNEPPDRLYDTLLTEARRLLVEWTADWPNEGGET